MMTLLSHIEIQPFPKTTLLIPVSLNSPDTLGCGVPILTDACISSIVIKANSIKLVNAHLKSPSDILAYISQ